MNRISDFDNKAMEKCNAFGFHPLRDPLGDDHHTDMPFDEKDKKMGDALAYFLGDLFCDVGRNPEYWYKEMTSVDIWQRVVRALRIHGLTIVDQKTP